MRRPTTSIADLIVKEVVKQLDHEYLEYSNSVIRVNNKSSLCAHMWLLYVDNNIIKIRCGTDDLNLSINDPNIISNIVKHLYMIVREIETGMYAFRWFPLGNS